MRLFNSLLAGLAVFAFATTASAGIFYTTTVTSSGDVNALLAGDTVTIGIHAETDTPEALALGLRATFDDSALSAGSVVTPASIFNFAPTVPFGGLTNSGNGLAGLITPSAGATPANVNLFQGVSVGPAASTGSLEGDQFSITFTVIGGGGPTDINIGAFAEFADTYAGGDNAQTPAVVTLTIVPEPGTALLMGLGLAGLATAGRRE